MKFGTCGHRIREDDIRRLWGERYLASGWESLGAAWKWKAIQRAFCPPRAGARWHYRQRLGSPRIGSAPTVTLRGLLSTSHAPPPRGAWLFFRSRQTATGSESVSRGYYWKIPFTCATLRRVGNQMEWDCRLSERNVGTAVGCFLSECTCVSKENSVLGPCLGEGVFNSVESRMSFFYSTNGAIFITAMVICTVACAQTLPSAAPGAPCATPGIAATYGANGMLLCSASLTWKPAIRASTPTNDGGLVSVVGQRMNRAMASIVDGTAQFVHDMLSPSSN